MRTEPNPGTFTKKSDPAFTGFDLGKALHKSGDTVQPKLNINLPPKEPDMLSFKERLLLMFAVSQFAAYLPGQSIDPTQLATPVPRLIRFAGTAKIPGDSPAPRSVAMTLSIYKDDLGGSALWMEVQNAEVDSQGRYTILLGAAAGQGVPSELFAGSEPRWLGVQIASEPEQPRVLLVKIGRAHV